MFSTQHRSPDISMLLWTLELCDLFMHCLQGVSALVVQVPDAFVMRKVLASRLTKMPIHTAPPHSCLAG